MEEKSSILRSKELQPYFPLTESEVKNLISEVKSQSPFTILKASTARARKDYETANNLLVYVIDHCLCIEEPDREIFELLYLCCRELADMRREILEQMDLFKTKEQDNQSTQEPKMFAGAINYDKFSGQFKFASSNKVPSKRVKFAVSKLNSMLYQFQTAYSENQEPILVVLKTYAFSYILTLVVLGLMMAVAISDFLFQKWSSISIIPELPLLIISVLMLIPLLIIYFKKPQDKSIEVFAAKMKEKIDLINLQNKSNDSLLVFESFNLQKLTINIIAFEEEQKPQGNQNQPESNGPQSSSSSRDQSNRC